MDALPSGPSTQLKLFSRIAQGALGLLLAAWLVFLLIWATIHWVIVPRIEDLRPFIESRASQALGLPIKIGSIRAESKGIIPSFELGNVRLLDPQGREALRLPKVLASLSPRSLWSLGFEQLYIDQPEIDVRRDAEGKIYLAGLDISAQEQVGQTVADWFFSQAEFAFRGGTITWSDATRQAPKLILRDVSFVTRNKLRQHAIRFDATPPEDWGARFSVSGKFRQPLLSTHAGAWRLWDGQLYGAFDNVDIAQLSHYLNPDYKKVQGRGELRAWFDINHATLTAATADISMTDMRFELNDQSLPLQLSFLSSRLSGRLSEKGFEIATEGLKFQTPSGLSWPGGNFKYSHWHAEGAKPQRGELKADQLDLMAISQIASQFPLGVSWLSAIKDLNAKGLVERIQASWQGSPDRLQNFQAKGKVSRLELAARSRSTAGSGKSPLLHLTSPGLSGAGIDFEFDQAGGKATVVVVDGKVELPGIFDEPVMDLKQFSSDLKWQLQAGRIALQMPNIKFGNADAQGEAQLRWQSPDPVASSHAWGNLDLQGVLQRVSLAQLPQYLPKVMDLQVREYLRNSLQQGLVSSIRFKVKGDLDHFPFPDPKDGEFKLSANVRDASIAYFPRSLQTADALPWPSLAQLSGELLIDRNRLQFKEISARIVGAPGMRLVKAEVLIPDYLRDPVARVSLEARGPVTEVLGVVLNGSPLGGYTGDILKRAQASGNAEYQAALALPLLALEKSTVQGKVVLNNNDIQVRPDTPRISRVRGTVFFNEKGVAVSALQARILGGELRADGGMIALPTAAGSPVLPNVVPTLRVQGTLTSEGLRLATELGAIARLAQLTSGSTTYAATLSFRRGAPEFLLTSSLQGLALNLPAPLNKSAETILPLRIETSMSREPQIGSAASSRLEDELRVELGKVLYAAYTRDVSRSQPRVLRGGIGFGLAAGETAPTPAEGVAAVMDFNGLNLDAWSEVWNLTKVEGKTGPIAEGLDGDAYLPNSLAIRANELTYAGRKLNSVLVGGSRIGPLWRANIIAKELNGYLEYREASNVVPGRVYARLARLSLAQANAKDVESLLDEQPISIPALDIVVDNFELRGKKLGRLEIEAINRGADANFRDHSVREWRLNKFNVTLPEASLTATGNWALVNEQNPASLRGQTPGYAAGRRRAVMNFKLDINDAGELLDRLGMKEVIRNGKGKLEGQMAWLGSPLTLDYPSLGGAFQINVENGQFLKADPGIAKLLGVLSLQSLPRRLALDFRDVFSDGFSFDYVRGDVSVKQGIAETRNLQMKGVNAAVLMEGSADIERETQDLKVVVVPEINAGTASLLATWINPAVGLSTFLAQMILRRPLMDSATQEFQIDGSWSDPKVTRLDSKLEPKKDPKSEVKK